MGMKEADNEMTIEDIDACQRIGRDEENRRSVIGLAELDALCDMARQAVRLNDDKEQAFIRGRKSAFRSLLSQIALE